MDDKDFESALASADPKGIGSRTSGTSNARESNTTGRSTNVSDYGGRLSADYTHSDPRLDYY